MVTSTETEDYSTCKEGSVAVEGKHHFYNVQQQKEAEFLQQKQIRVASKKDTSS